MIGLQRAIATWWLDVPSVVERLESFPMVSRRFGELQRLMSKQLVTPADIELDFAATVASYGQNEPWWETYCEPILQAFDDPQEFRLSWMLGTTGNLCATRRQVCDVGAFDERFCKWGLEDNDLCYRLWRAGADVRVCREAVSYHQVHPTVAERFDDWSRNYEYFAKKYDCVDVLLFCLVLQKRMTVNEAQALVLECDILSREGRSRVLEELKRAYGHLVGLGAWR